MILKSVIPFSVSVFAAMIPETPPPRIRTVASFAFWRFDKVSSRTEGKVAARVTTTYEHETRSGRKREEIIVPCVQRGT